MAWFEGRDDRIKAALTGPAGEVLRKIAAQPAAPSRELERKAEKAARR